MVEQERSLPREQWGPFLLVGTQDGAFLIHPRIKERPAVRKGDLETLADSGLLRRDFGSKGTPRYEIKPEGRRYYAEMKKRGGEASQTIEDEVRGFLRADAFRESFRLAYERWREAEEALWDAESEAEFTRIGHICREAMQLFASVLALRAKGADSPVDPSKTVERIRSVLAGIESQGDAQRRFLDGLLNYWGTVSDLVQRQEHGAQKGGEPLVWEDARRAVFQTMIVMFEVARAVK